MTRFLAGGTDVLVQLRAAMVRPDDLIDIKKIPGTAEISRTADGGWRIGVAVAGAQLGAHAGLKADWPGVVEGMELVGSTQVQGRATLTGNLCNGSPAADSVPGLVAAGAVAEITGPAGKRTVAVEDIPTGPGRTSLTKGEVISALLLPPRGAHGGDAYLRFIRRTEMDIAVVAARFPPKARPPPISRNAAIARGNPPPRPMAPRVQRTSLSCARGGRW